MMHLLSLRSRALNSVLRVSDIQKNTTSVGRISSSYQSIRFASKELARVPRKATLKFEQPKPRKQFDFGEINNYSKIAPKPRGETKEEVQKWLGVKVEDPPAAFEGLENAPTLIMKRNIGALSKNVYFNNPDSLNTIDHHTIRYLRALVKKWDEDIVHKSVVFNGVGNLAFCAGVDARELLESAEAREHYFSHYYNLLNVMHNSRKPFVPIADGITAGAGASLFLHGGIRVATEKTIIAFPETSMGFFPAGSIYHLSRLGALGFYLALTGKPLEGSDTIHAGLANFYIPSARASDYVDRLSNINSVSADRHYAGLIEYIDDEIPEFSLAQYMDVIVSAFSQPTVPAILASLDEQNQPWATQIATHLRTLSPSSLAITLRLLIEARELSHKDVSKMEYRVAKRITESNEFKEGVTALVVENRTPSWNQTSEEGQTTTPEVNIEEYFAPLEKEKELGLKSESSRATNFRDAIEEFHKKEKLLEKFYEMEIPAKESHVNVSEILERRNRASMETQQKFAEKFGPASLIKKEDRF